jgi:hypothetical protein
MLAYLARRQRRAWGYVVLVVAILVGFLAGFAVVVAGEQYPTEVLLEYAAGSLVMLAGAWWLQGYGPGLLTMPEASQQTEPE